jgi:ketosteroid isomerase-like protein|tara:strand:- start:223 stop:612 length:390 start_codon:yes stop_codon:yes gene_type:complete
MTSAANIENFRIGERFMTSLECCDIDTTRNIYAVDAKLWHNFDQSFQSVEENIKTLQWLHRKLSDVVYEIVVREAIPGGFYQQHILRGTLASGEKFAMPACAIVKVKAGRIVSLDEYLDSQHTVPLLQS